MVTLSLNLNLLLLAVPGKFGRFALTRILHAPYAFIFNRALQAEGIIWRVLKTSFKKTVPWYYR